MAFICGTCHKEHRVPTWDDDRNGQPCVDALARERDALAIKSAAFDKMAVGLLEHVYEGGCPDQFDQNRRAENCPVCKIMGPAPEQEPEVVPVEGRLCWFAEVDAGSKAACTHCKDLSWPKPGWISCDGNFLTADRRGAKWWETREQAAAFCSQSHVRHWHVVPTEHMFVR